MTITVTKRHFLLGVVALGLTLLGVGIAARVSLTGLAVDAALKAAGASDIRFHVVQASLWRVVVEDIGFLIRLQSFAAKEVTLERTHWWTPSLGKVRVAQARMELKADQSPGRPPPAPAKPSTKPVNLPLEEISVDGQLVIRLADVPDQALTVKIEAKPASPGSWTASTQVTGPGLVLKGTGTYALASGDLAFKVPEASLDLKAWQDFLHKLAPATQGSELDGKFSGNLEGRLAGGSFTANGEWAVQLPDGPAHALVVKLEARKIAGESWSGDTQVRGPGLSLRGAGTYDFASENLAFKLSEVSLDLQTWRDFLQRTAPAANAWEFEGKISGNIEGQQAGDEFNATATIQWRDGRGVSAAQSITAEGIEADLEFADLAKLLTKSATLRVREVRTGQLTMSDLRGDFALVGADRIDVAHLSLQALGGHISTEPFNFSPSRAQLDAVLLVEDVSVEEVMALTKDLPAQAIGRVNGRVPVQIGSDGLRFGTGWLELRPGVHAEIQFKAKGLLTGGVAPGSPRYTALEQVESGLRKMKLNALRLDIRPPNSPEGRSAQLHLKGEPLDKTAQVPINLDLDLNVNGPLEQMLNLGMNSRVNVGSKP